MSDSIGPTTPVVASPADESAPRKNRPHLPFLDGVRAMAALYVVLHHASTNLRTLGSPTLSPLLDYGHFAVDVFIVLSGFSLMLPVAFFGNLKGGGRLFLVRRARRIVPPYLFALVFSAVLGTTLIAQKTGTVWDNSLPVTLRALILHLILAQDLFPRLDHSIDYPLWSVSVESHIYLLFPLIVAAFARFKGWAVVLTAAVAGYAVLLLLDPTPINTDGDGVSPYYLGLFTFGCLAAQIAVTRASKVRWYPAATVFGSIVGLRVAGHFWYGHYVQALPEQLASLFIGLIAASVLLALGSGQWPILRRALSWHPLAFLGTFAYSIYLIHGPILQLVWQYLVHPTGLIGRREPLVLSLVATPIIVLTSWLFFIAFERPFISRSPAAERLAAP